MRTIALFAWVIVLGLGGIAVCAEEAAPPFGNHGQRPPLGNDERVVQPAAKTPADDIKVTLEIEKMPLREFLGKLLKLGAQIVVSDAVLEDASTVSLKVVDAPLSEVVAAVCHALKLDYMISTSGVISISFADDNKSREEKENEQRMQRFREMMERMRARRGRRHNFGEGGPEGGFQQPPAGEGQEQQKREQEVF